MIGYRIERLSPDNLHFLVSLYRHSFKARVSVDFLKKKYDTGHFGASYIGFLAFHSESGEAAAYYGVFPMVCVIDGKNILTAQSGDTMTAPEHQGKGLFVTLAKETYELAKKEGVEFVFGFPNENSYPGFVKKLQWQFPGNVNHYFIKSGRPPFDKVAKKIPLFDLFFKHFVRLVLKRFRYSVEFENSLSLIGTRCFIRHGKDFYSYKSYSDYYTISLKGVSCIVKVDGRLWVGDVNTSNDDQYLSTISELRKLARRLGCSTIQVSCTEGTRFDGILAKSPYRKAAIAAGFINLGNNVDPRELAFTAFDFDTY